MVEVWRKSLTPVDDLAAALRLRRLLHDYPDGDVEQACRDGHGRYVLVVRLNSGLWSFAEWPVALSTTKHWTDKTVLAGDDEDGTTMTLLALTPTEDGRMLIDPVPLLPRSDRDAFAYGYGGGTPATTYRALLRCALGDVPGVTGISTLDFRGLDGTSTSQLWAAISITKGPLRLSWPQLKQWARADAERAFKDLDNR